VTEQEIRIGILEKENDVLVEALQRIATTSPTHLAMNGHALVSDPDYLKLRNNHMIVAQNTLIFVDKKVI
jgi:pectin methylesterase-like acyl-CoA thioesterase